MPLKSILIDPAEIGHETLSSELSDTVRKTVGPENISFVNGNLALTLTGVHRLASAVATGELPGDQVAARKMLSDLTTPPQNQ